MENERKIIGKCPVCGGDVVKSCKGYRCINSVGEHPACSFSLPGVVCNRRISDEETARLLAGEKLLLDGFCSNELRQFSSVLSLDAEHKTHVDSKVGRCPCCGGDIYVGLKGFNCSNYRNQEQQCKFVIWRSYGGHEVTLREVEEILAAGVTSEPVSLFREDGGIYLKRLGINPDKEQVVKI